MARRRRLHVISGPEPVQHASGNGCGSGNSHQEDLIPVHG
jgi:hypothetical protein